MRKHYFFREGDFFKWHSACLKSKDYIRYYRYYFDIDRKRNEIKQYEEAKKIVEDYKIYICSLNDDEKMVLDKLVNDHNLMNLIPLTHPNIIDNWKTIVLDSRKYDLDNINLKLLGDKIKKWREDSGYYRAEAARYLGISERTLKYYEDGEREIGLNLFYKLIQLYKVGDLYNFFNSE